MIERDGAVSNPEGLDVEALSSWFRETGGVKGFPGGQYHPNGVEVLASRCDILIPAAVEGVIHRGNAHEIRARLIVEGANGPITAAADEILRARGILVIPDLYANAGGVIVSYFEWVKNLSHMRFGRLQRRAEEAKAKLLVEELERLSADRGLGWTLSPDFKARYLEGADELSLVRSGLDDTMREAYRAMRTLWRSRKDVPDLRTAAYMLAIQRVAESYRSKGL